MGIDRTDTGAGVVEGDSTDNDIYSGYVGDPEGDRIDHGDASLPGEFNDDDIVNAGDGNDTVESGAGDDEVFGGEGDDLIDGGTGNDLLLGDRDIADNVGTVRESFEWDLAPDPDGADGTPGIDNGDPLSTFTQNTGNVDVTFSTVSSSPQVTTNYADGYHNVDGIVGDGSPVDAFSSLDNVLGGAGNETTYSVDFSSAVSNVQFRVNDIDGDGIVRITALDAAGNPITVNLTAGADITLLDTDGVAGADTADSDGGYGEDSDANYSMLVEIPGPVSEIIIEHDQDGPDNSGIKVSDIHFDATPGDIASGNDTIDGDIGDDTIFGEGGDDELTGGEGADEISGGDDADTIIGGTDGDVADGGTGGDDNDTLDLRDAGPLRVINETVDADGDSTSGTVEFLDGGGQVTGSMEFIEIENLLLPGGGGGNQNPTPMDDVIGTSEDDAVTIDVLTNDSDPDGDPLTVTGATDGANGSTVVNGDGTITYTPDPGTTGPDSFTYTVSDGNGGTGTATVNVTVSPDGALDGIVQGTPGDDLIDLGYTGDPHGDRIDNLDEILPGEGPNDDIVIAGDGNDTVVSGEGSDDVDGGDGDDVIDTGAALPLPDDGFNDPFDVPQDADTENDRDIVSGGAGNDTISTGDDRDTIDGGIGDDMIDGGLDDDTILAGEGNDVIIAGEGSDTVRGEEGDDTIYGGINFPGANIIDAIDPELHNGDDVLDGGAGNDLIFGEDDNDTLFGRDGDDTLNGGIDDDDLRGNDGNDVLNGGQGADIIRGQEDRDTIIVDSAEDGAGDIADGGGQGDDYDVLDLSAIGRGNFEVVNETLDADRDSTSGTVNFLDGGGNITGSMEFLEIERIIPCFTPGTLIATPKGERKVEDLEIGDRVITRDNGLQEIRWVGRRDLEGQELLQAKHLKPVLIRAGALGRGLPEQDLLVSPNHRVLINNEKSALYFEDREVLVAAKHLTDLEGVDAVDTDDVTYIHFMFDQHEVVLSNGSWTESFQPGEQTLGDMDDAQREEIYTLFPELRDVEGINAYQAARRSLKKHEARLLTK